MNPKLLIPLLYFLLAYLSVGNWAMAQEPASPCDSSGYVLSLAVNNISCPGAATGVASIASTGCVCMFSGCVFTWSNGQNGHTATGLAPGIHSVTVTHPNGCIMDTSIMITEPARFVESLAKEDPSCYGANNGLVAVIPATDSGPLTYRWSTGDTLSASIANLTAGKYYVTTTNFINCSLIDSVVLNEPPVLSTNALSTSSCSNEATGSVLMTITGGTPPYACLWSDNSIIEDLYEAMPGAYQVMVTDANGCTAEHNATVAAISAPQPNVTAFNTTICAGSSTQIIATVAGGGIFAWSPATGLSNPNTNAPIASPSQTTTYIVTATAPNGCSGTAQVTIAVEVCNDITAIDQTNEWSIFPNPVIDLLSVATVLPQPDDLQIHVYNSIGQRVWQQSYAQQSGKFDLQIPTADLTPGTYIIEVISEQRTFRRKIAKY